jgi:hypothetical protein
MLLYLEKDLDNAYKIDCKERTKKDKPWIKREEFRGVYEELITLYLQKAEEHIFVDISLEDLPGWVLGEVERTLQNKIEISFEDNT